jgi:hypothetical protein
LAEDILQRILRGSGLGYEVVAERENESFHEKKFLVMGRGGGVCWTLTKAHQQVHGIWIKMLHLLPSPAHTATGLAFLDLPLPQTNPRGKEKQD